MKKINRGLFVTLVTMVTILVFSASVSAATVITAANLRDNDDNIVGVLYAGTEVDILYTVGDRTWISANGVQGSIMTSCISETSYTTCDDWYWYEPECNDFYQSEYPINMFEPVMINDWANFYSFGGEYICTIPGGTYVQPIETIGANGSVTAIYYGGYEGFIQTCYLISYDYVSYEDDIYVDDGTLSELPFSVNLRDENGNIITQIPAGSVVEVLYYDDATGRYWVYWQGLYGSIMNSAISYEPEIVYEDYCEFTNDYIYESNPECIVNEGNYGSATVTTTEGANLRDSNNQLIVAIPCGQTVTLLGPLNVGGRTSVSWGNYVGTVLTSCLA